MSHAKDSIHKYSHLFKKEAYTEREAFVWLVENNENRKISCSIRSLAKNWNWSEARARRFIAKLAGAAVIDAQSDARGTVITLHESLLEQPNDLKDDIQTDVVFDAPNDAALPHYSSGFKLNDVALSDALNIGLKPAHQHDAHIDAVNSYTSSLVDCILPQITETLTDAVDDAADHLSLAAKKKEKKQKKEKTIKEKNTPFRVLKKENFSPESPIIGALPAEQPQSKKQIKFDEVTIDHVEVWASKHFPDLFNLQWELEKFKDYWLSSHKRHPKDGIAAFRNWLRKAYEFQQIKEIRHGKHNKTTSTDSLHNFMQAGARIIAKYHRH